MDITKLSSVTLLLKKYLDREIIVESVVLEISRVRNK